MSRERVDPVRPVPDLSEPAPEPDEAVLREFVKPAPAATPAPILAAAPSRQRLTIDTTTLAELDERGEAVHIGTGLLLKRDKGTGEITAHHRGTGERVDVQIPRIRRLPR